MSQLDPVIVRQFGWASALDPATIMTDPDVMQRVLASYIDDPDYAFPEVETRDEIIDGPLGPSSFPVRVYGATDGARGRPALVWAHGGGFMSGTLDDNEAHGVSREVASRADVVVISVGYHVADGTISYPTLHRELSAAVDWTIAHADELGIDPAQITVGGASAGANLALAAVLERRDLGQPLPRGLALVYPALEESVTPASTDADLTVLPTIMRISPESLAFMFQMYRGAAADTRYSTLEGHDLRGLPDTLVVAAEFDDLRPSATAYTTAARDAGVVVRDVLEEGAAHGFLAMTPRVAANERTLTTLAEFTHSGIVS